MKNPARGSGRHTMVSVLSGWLHQARLIGSLQALVYFVILCGSDITQIGYRADFGVDPKFRIITRL